MLVKLRFLILFLTFFFTLNLVYASTKLTQIKESIEPYCNGESPNNFLNHKSIKNIEYFLIEAKNKLKALENLSIHSIKQPIAKEQFDVMEDLCRKSPVPIALDEELI